MSIKLGDKNIKEVYVGNKKVSVVIFNNTIVYKKEGGNQAVLIYNNYTNDKI